MAVLAQSTVEIRMKLLPLTIIIASLLLAGAKHAMAEPDKLPPESSVATLSVSGQAELKVAPDQVTIDLGVSTIATTADKAMADNNATMQRVVDALREMGLKPETRQFRLQALWTPRPAKADPDWQAAINGYKVDNSIIVVSTDLSLAGDIIAGATGAGANHINGVSFGLSQPRQHREAAIKQATENAASDAQSLAAAAGQTLLRIINLNLDHSDASPVQLRQQNMLRSVAMAEDAGGPPLEAADVSVRAAVSVRYEIH
jgi:uncharacterized protein YggE